MNRNAFGFIPALLLSAFAVVFIGTPQAQAGESLVPQVIKAKSFVKTEPLRSMQGLNLPPIMRQAVGNNHYTAQQLAQLRSKLAQAGYIKAANQYFTIPLLKKQPAMETPPVVKDPVVQRGFAQRGFAPRGFGFQAKDFTVPSASFDALGASTSGGDGCAPPDTNAAAGANNQVVEIVNCAGGAGQGTFAVYDKTGTLLLGPVALGNLWTSGICQTGGHGDNVVDYDQLAQRWVITQFAGTGVPTDQCIAISQTGDATGAYFVYDFAPFPNAFNDYPKISVWPDAYYQTLNLFNTSGSAFIGEGYVAYQRSAMLNGDPNAEMVFFQGNGNDLAYSVLPADLDGSTLPPAGAPGIFVDYVSPYLWGTSYYALEMWQLHVDWTTPSNSTLTGPTQITVAQFDDGICAGSRSCIPQPSPGEGLDSLGDRLMFRLAYRDGVGSDLHQALVVNQTVGSGSPSDPPSGIRWYELDAPAGSTDPTQWTVAQQGTYMPSDGSSRWMGSIAMDQSGNMALGYSLSSPSINPSIAYTGRLATDPAGQMTQPETTVITGGGVQVSTADRWGDYSSMVMDPTDDCTFWYSQEYYATTGSFAWSTHIAAFKFPNCASGPSGTLTGTVTDAGTGNPIANATITLTPNQIVVKTDQNGNYTLNLPVGTYTDTATDFGYTSQSVSVTISNGQTTTQNFALVAAPSATVSGNLVDGTPGGHTYGLYGEIKVTTPGFGQVADIWTNPTTGAYSVNLPEGSDYTFNGTAYLQGYTSGSATITGLSGNTTQNIAVTVGAGCSAPGYSFISGFGQDFDEGFPPTGWTITSISSVAWNTNTFWNDQNYTGGSGIAATADSNRAGGGPYDTSLITPEIPVSSLGTAPILKFDMSFLVYSGNEALDVDVSGDGGTTWTNVAHFTTNQGTLYGLPGVAYQTPLTIPSGATQIELRWRYYNAISGFDWYAQVDDISIGQCGAVSGGLVVGAVSDSNTGTGLVGANIADDETPPATTKTFQNTADPNLPVGYYFLFAGTGNRTVTASDSGYSNSSATLTMADNNVVVQNFALAAGRLSGTPAAGFTLHVMVNNQVTKTFTVANTGNASANFQFLTFDNPPPSAPGQTVGAPLNLVACTHLSPLSLAEQIKQGGHGFGCGDDGGNMANFGGGGGSLSPDDAPWTNIANYPTPIMDNSAAQDPASGLVYSFAGYNGSANVGNAYVYDGNANTWTPIASMPAALEKPTGVFINGQLYVADGWDSSGNPSPALNIYNPSSNTWTAGANNPVPWGGGAVAVALNNKMYVIGGCSASACGETTVEVYDPSAGTWSSAAAYPHTDSWESCGAIGGKIYCAGGSATNEYADGFVYDPASDSWSPIASIPVTNGGLWGSGYTATSQGLLISGGVTANFTQVTNQGFIYSPSSNTWTALPNSNNSLYRGGSSCGFDKFGGSTGGFSPVPNSEMLPGYNVCGTSPIPWLTLNPISGTVAAGQSVPVSFVFNGTGQAEFTTSQAYVMLTGNTPYGSQIVPLTVTWDPQPVNMGLTGSVNLSKVETGDVIVYSIQVHNYPGNNQGSATQVVLNYTMPANVTYISSNGPAPCTATGFNVTCNIGTMAPGAVVKEQILVTDSAVQKLVSNFKVTEREPNINSQGGKLALSTNVVGIASVSVAYSASAASVPVGSPVTYNIQLNNAGPDAATGLTVTAPLPSSLDFVSATSNSGTCSYSSGLVTCAMTDLANQGTASIAITAKPNAVGSISTLVTAGTDSVDPQPNGLTGSTTITVVPAAAPPSGTGTAPQSSGGSNGGGGIGLGGLAALAALLVLTRTRRRRSTPQ